MANGTPAPDGDELSVGGQQPLARHGEPHSSGGHRHGRTGIRLRAEASAGPSVHATAVQELNAAAFHPTQGGRSHFHVSALQPAGERGHGRRAAQS